MPQFQSSIISSLFLVCAQTHHVFFRPNYPSWGWPGVWESSTLVLVLRDFFFQPLNSMSFFRLFPSFCRSPSFPPPSVWHVCCVLYTGRCPTNEARYPWTSLLFRALNFHQLSNLICFLLPIWDVDHSHPSLHEEGLSISLQGPCLRSMPQDWSNHYHLAVDV